MDILSGENILLAGSILLIAGVIIGKTSYRTGLPLLLVFLLVGMLFGTDGLGLQFGDMHQAQFIGMVALCIILFSGGMATSVRAIRPILAPGLVLATAGVLLTGFLTGMFIFWLSDMPWTNIHFALLPSLLLASTMSSTDSASVFGILGSQKVQLRHNLRPMLELESGSNDPMAYMLTIILIEAITLDHTLSASTLGIQLALQFGIGAATGAAMGYISRWLIGVYRKIGKRAEGEDAGQATSMISILILGFVFLTYTATTAMQGNGYLAVYICGMVLGNSRLPYRRSIGKFMDGLTWLAQIVVFLMLGLLVNPHEMVSVAAVSFLIGLFIIFIGRPLSVFLCLAPFRKIGFRTKTFISWVGLRGAVPIIFATYPVVADVPGAAQIFNIVFFVTLLSLVVQGTSVIRAADALGLVDNEAKEEPDFGVELSDEHPTSLRTLVLTPQHLSEGNTLGSISLPEGGLVIMIRRDGRYIVPNGKRRLQVGDTLLIIKESEERE
ncbi:MAG: potassium/proton antiporter [Muribaculaceae bacterium]|nr:potassium/proton antiporter [Muribaculaceae bacterium]